MNPEQHIVDEIDKLVDEALEAGPQDDYTVDRYPRCDKCGFHWHGLPDGDCPQSTGERENLPTRRTYFDQVESVRYTDDRTGRSYTLSNAEETYPRQWRRI